MFEYELELSIGDVVQVGDCLVTVIDIEGDEISLRIDPLDSPEPAAEHRGLHVPPGK